MSNAPDPTDYLRDIAENAAKAEAFTARVDFDEFLANEMRAYATIRALEIIGAKRIFMDTFGSQMHLHV